MEPRGDTAYGVRECVKRIVHFKVHNLLKEEPPGLRFDLIFCRNVMIYFDKRDSVRARRREVSSKALLPDGYLFIGHSESLMGGSTQFQYALRLKAPIYKKTHARGCEMTMVRKEQTDMIKVLIVDDSPLVRKIAADILTSDPEISVIGTASNAEIALQRIQKNRPDVITMDIEMPGMGGLAAISEIMSVSPTPIIVLSAFAKRGAELTMQALDLGAVDFIPSPFIRSRGV